MALCAFGTLCPAHADSSSPYNFTRRFGGSDGDFPTAVIVDQYAWGFPVIAGYTYSTNFPGARPRPGADPNDADIFVTRLNTFTGEIVWSVVLGGSGTDIPAAVTTDPFGNVWVAGRTVSTNFPTTNALQSTASGGSDAFLFRLGFDGKVEYRTYLGGSGHDAATGVAIITNTMEVVVAGTTSSPDFPEGQTGETASIDGFVVCLDWYGTNVTLATALRGSDLESPSAVAIDRWNDIYVAGWTRSLDFPVTPGAYRSEMSFSNDGEAFVTKLDRSTGSLVYSTFLGIRTASPVVLAVDWGESAYVGGTEQSFSSGAAGPRAPGTPVPPPAVHWNFESGFFARLTPSGSQLDIRRYDTSGRDSVRTVTRGVHAVTPTDYQTGVAVAGTLGQHPFTDFQPAPAFSTRPVDACGDEFTHLFAFSLYGWFYHVSGLSPSTARPPGVPVPSAIYEDRRRADILVQAYTDTPGQVSPVAGLSFVNTYENRFGSNEVIYLRVDGGDVNGQLGSITVLSGTNIVAAFDGAPRLLALSNLPPALYNLTAIAQNTAGARSTSCPLSFTVLAAPRNDSFYRATHIDGTFYVTNATNEGASAEPTEPVASSLYYATPRRSVWWCWEAPVSGPFAIEITSDKISPQVGVYVGSNLSQLERVASAGPGSNVVSAFKATAGTHYFFSVDSPYSGDFLFRLRPAVPPSNDDHTNRIAITGADFTIIASNIDATREPGLAFDYPDSPASVWWHWTAPAAGRYLASVASQTFSPALDIHNVTNPNAGMPGFDQPRVVFTAAAGEQFDFRVAASGGAMGNFMLSVSNLAAPPNDSLSAAMLINDFPALVSGTTLGATIEPNEPGSATASVWYRWTAPSNVTVAVEIAPVYASELRVYSGTALSNLVFVGGEFGNALVVFPAVAGRDYYFSVDDYYGVIANFTLTLRPARTPANDNFANAIVLSGFPVSVPGSNREASLEPGEPSHFEGSVWYRWIAPSNGHYALSIAGSSYGSFLVTPYTGTSLSNLARATIASPAPEFNSATRFFGSAGTEYYLAVSGYGGYGDLFRLRIRAATPPTNDNFADRIALLGTTVETNGSTLDASVESGEPLDDTFGDKTVWWSWTAPESRKMVFWLSNMSQSFQLRVFNGTTLSALSPAGLGFGFYAMLVDAQAAQTYAIQVAGRSPGTFTLNVAPAVPPPNDHFTNAFTLTGLSAWAIGTGLGATLEPGESSHTINNAGSVWWNWTAPVSGRVTLASQGSVGVYTGASVSSLTYAGELSSRPSSGRTFIARAGVTYRIVVHSTSVQPFDLVLTAPAPPPSPELASMRRLASGSFEFQFDAIMGQTNVIDASTDLIHWVPIATNFLDCGVLNVLDPAAVGFPHRFYRLRAP